VCAHAAPVVVVEVDGEEEEERRRATPGRVKGIR